MATAKVFFTNMRTKLDFGLPDKFRRLVERSDFGKMDMTGKFVAIKLHFGERGNMGYLRPEYVRVIAEFVKAHGGYPFATDCSTLYVGGRKNNIDHLETAQMHGFNPTTCGCQIIIGDGLKGGDDVNLPVPRGQLTKTAKIGRTVADADILVSLTHFKCHEMMSFGGAVKNLGMGCASRRGKMELHSSEKPTVRQDLCRGCKSCLKVCAQNALTVTSKKAHIDPQKCVGCGMCIATCPFDAIEAELNEGPKGVTQKTVEYAAALCTAIPNYHFSIMTDIAPCCDCRPENDLPIIPNVGMLASADPVALDRACIDLANRQTIIPGSQLAEACHGRRPADIFECVNPGTSPEDTFDHAEKIGFGTVKYELVTIC